MKNLKRFDRIIYMLTLVLGVVTSIIISYLIVFGIMNMGNSPEISKLLISINIYQPFYKVLNVVNGLFVAVFCIGLVIFLPYLIISLFLFIVFIIKYIKFKGKKIIKLIITFTLCCISLGTLLLGIITYPITKQYEIRVNSKISDISNQDVREFLEEMFEEDFYVRKIKINQGIPDDYNAIVSYGEKKLQISRKFLSKGEYSEFVNKKTKDVTVRQEIRGIFITLLGNILYIYFLRYILKTFNILTGCGSNNISETDNLQL